MSEIHDRYAFIDLANWEHRQVRNTIRCLEQVLQFPPQRDAGISQVARVAELLGELTDELRRHFLKETEGGVLEEATCRVPGLACRVAPVMEAWPTMVGRVDALREMAAAAKQDRIPASMATLIRQVLKDVAWLESAEDDILASAFGVNLDSSGQSSLS